MELDQALAKLHTATSGELYDADWDGGTWMCKAVQTAESLADFEQSAKSYRECGNLERGTLAGFPFICFGEVQVAKGHERQTLSVIDLGTTRFAVSEDLTRYA